MSAGRCATCRFWNNPPANQSVGLCDRLSYSTAHADAWIDDGGPHDDDSGEVSTARFATRASFGCTEHEPTQANVTDREDRP